MKDYEAVYIFDSALDEAGINTKLERYHGLVTGDDRGELAAVDHWGKRQLAYPIEDRENGYYVVSHFSANADSLPEFERILKLDEELLRYIVVVNEGELATTPAVQPDRTDEDEEDE